MQTFSNTKIYIVLQFTIKHQGLEKVQNFLFASASTDSTGYPSFFWCLGTTRLVRKTLWLRHWTRDRTLNKVSYIVKLLTYRVMSLLANISMLMHLSTLSPTAPHPGVPGGFDLKMFLLLPFQMGI